MTGCRTRLNLGDEGDDVRIALFIGGQSEYTGPAMRILPRTGERLYLSQKDASIIHISRINLSGHDDDDEVKGRESTEFDQ